MGNTAVKKTKGSGFFSNLVRQQMLIPVAALVILAVFNLIADPSFFRLWFRTCHLSDRHDTGNGCFRRTGYQCGRYRCHCGQCDPACTLWFQFQTGDTSYLSFGGILGSMSCIYVIWSIQRCPGSPL